MSTPKKILVATAMTTITFGLSFLVSYFVRKSGQVPRPPSAERAGEAGAPGAAAAHEDPAAAFQPHPREQQLAKLIRQLKDKEEDYKRKDRQLELRHKRLNIAMEELRRQAQELENVRLRVATLLPQMESAIKTLQKTRLVIRKEEEANLQTMAETCNRMSPELAAGIFLEMARHREPERKQRGAKILSLMSDRTSAKVLQSLKSDVAVEYMDLMRRISKPEAQGG